MRRFLRGAPPPAECLHCAAGFEACAATDQDNGGTGEDCAVGFAGCLAACEGNSQCAGETDAGETNGDGDPDACNPEPPTNECDACDQDFDQCINDGWADQGDENQGPAGETEQCEEQWDACHQSCDDAGVPGDDNLCQLAEEQCANNPDGFFELADGEVRSCQDIHEDCFDQDPSDPNEPPCDCDACDEAQSQCEADDNSEDCQDIQDYCNQSCP